MEMPAHEVESLATCFEVDTTSEWGTSKTIELRPGGKSELVTAANRQGMKTLLWILWFWRHLFAEFVDLYMRYKLERSISPQFEAFKRGFLSLCDCKALLLCEPEELEQMICGSPIHNFEALERATRYVGFGGEDSHPDDEDVVRRYAL